MRVATALHSHAVRAEKPARKSPASSVIPDRFCCLLRRADCATGYTVHRRRNNLWTLEIVDPFSLDEISDLTRFTTARRIGLIELIGLTNRIVINLLSSSDISIVTDTFEQSYFFTETHRRSRLKHRICIAWRRIVCESRYHVLVIIIIQDFIWQRHF